MLKIRGLVAVGQAGRPSRLLGTEVTKADMVVDGEDFVSQSVAGHLRDAGYTFYRESMLVLG